MNVLDRAINYFSPEAGQRRSAARLRSSGLTRARMLYDGATTGHRGAGWRPAATDANQEVRLGGSKLRENARDMVRNNPYAFRAKAAIGSNVVGTGIIPNVVSKSSRSVERLEELLIEHFDTTHCDASGGTNLYGLQSQIMGTVVESGECFVRYRPRHAADGHPLPFQLQVLEPDYLDLLQDGPLKNGNFAVQGIEFNKIGGIVGYHLFNEHPGNSRTYSSPKSSLVPADMIAHVFRADRPGQVRGVSWYAPVILRLRDFTDFSDAQLMRQKIAACFAAFITGESEETTGLTDETVTSGRLLEQFEPGMIERLRPGENVEFAAPPSVGDFSNYSSVTLHEIAAGLGISYEALTGDLQGVNFSSGRMGWLEFQRNIDSWRHTMLEPQLNQKIADWFLKAARLSGELVTRDTRIKWTPPRREMISPKDEIPYMAQAVRSGFMTRSEIVRRNGYDPLKLDQELADDNKRQDKLGLILDTDPRQRTAGGNAVNTGSEDGDQGKGKSEESGSESDEEKAAA